MAILRLNDLRDTTIWQRLNTGFRDTPHGDLAAKLAGTLPDICEEAQNRMKAVQAQMSQYTLHDGVHLLRVTQLMALIGGHVTDRLNPIELALLVLSAHYHDHGMVLDTSEYGALERDPSYQLFVDNWILDHPNLGEIETQAGGYQPRSGERAHWDRQADDLRRAMRTEFMRYSHPERSRRIVRTQHESDPRWILEGVNLADLVGLLCESHGRDPEWLQSQPGAHYDRSIGTYKVNVPYLGVLLRLADILDLDSDRTPDTLWRAIHFTNDISIAEWEKHRSIKGWEISSERIRFTAECTHPVYEQTLRSFMDQIDRELASCHKLVTSFPGSTASHYPLLVPQRVERDRIGPRNDAYKYHDLQFSLSRDEIVKLLMTDRLYSSASLFVRELLQNSLDALRYRKALHATHHLEWSIGDVKLEHVLDPSGYEVVRCHDNGVGMDEDVVTRFLTRAGRSFYRSPEFERERVRFRQAGVDFDPCARFGIGFMSCFMFGDRITIKTRRDFGPAAGYGEPLIVEINGLGGLVVLRRGDAKQPIGTSVEIFGRRKSAYVAPFNDSVKLTRTIEAHALATEFPIVATTTVPGLEAETRIPTSIATRESSLKTLGFQQRVDITQDFSDVDHHLRGALYAAFLKDEHGLPTTKNAEAHLELVRGDKDRSNEYRVVRTNGMSLPIRNKYNDHSATCVDGIFVAGTPGRNSDAALLEFHSSPVDLEYPYVLDIRGSIKPELTPARTPVDSPGLPPVGWRRIRRLAESAEGRIWERMASHTKDGLKPETFWDLFMFYRASVHGMRAGVVWNSIPLPIQRQVGGFTWGSFRELGDLTYKRGGFFDLAGGHTIHPVPPSSIPGLAGLPENAFVVAEVVTSLCCLARSDKRVILRPTAPDDPETVLGRTRLGRAWFDRGAIVPMPYVGEMKSYLMAKGPLTTINSEHPLYLQSLEGDRSPAPSAIQQFARELILVLGSLGVRQPPTEPFEEVLPRARKVLGHLHRAVDWNDARCEIKWPLQIFVESLGDVSMSHETFDEWADLDVSKEVVG